jgi:hypothetical protein
MQGLGLAAPGLTGNAFIFCVLFAFVGTSAANVQALKILREQVRGYGG